ncbi:MAG: DUF2306 domain-containing protein [Pseudomonadota bacterium]
MSRRLKMSSLAWFAMTLGSVLIVIYAVVAYTLFPPGDLVHPQMKRVFERETLGILAPIFGSSVALLLGPFQFLPGIRARALQAHRWMGRVYLGFGVAIGGLAGGYMAFFAFGGLVSKSGFFFLALIWLITGALALKAVPAGRIHRHREWMIRNFALTFAVVTLRIQLGLSGAAGLNFKETYPLIAWACWVPNLIVADWLVRRSQSQH